ncbi:MAG: hypothetical protein VB092_02405 [Oscillospiraceae bacterium]|nr:hypothetical protein [Oscillospiraceae bacterium]
MALRKDVTMEMIKENAFTKEEILSAIDIICNFLLIERDQYKVSSPQFNYFEEAKTAIDEIADQIYSF